MKLTHPPKSTTGAGAVVPLLLAIVAGFGCAPFPGGARIKTRAVDVRQGQLQNLEETPGYFVCTADGSVVQMVGSSTREEAGFVYDLLPEDDRSVSLKNGVVHRYPQGMESMRWGELVPRQDASDAPFDEVKVEHLKHFWFSVTLGRSETTPETSWVLTSAHWIELHPDWSPTWVRNTMARFNNWTPRWTAPDPYYLTLSPDDPPSFGGITPATRSRYWRLSGGAHISADALPVRQDDPSDLRSSVGEFYLPLNIVGSYDWQYLCISACQPSGTECTSAILSIEDVYHMNSEVFGRIYF